jgi:hypothetical protein
MRRPAPRADKVRKMKVRIEIVADFEDLKNVDEFIKRMKK